MAVTMTSTAEQTLNEQNERELTRREAEERAIAERLLTVTNGFRAMLTSTEKQAAYKWLGEYFKLS